MKKVKMGLMAIVAITGIGAGFAFSPKTPKDATTYYAVKSGSSFVWQTTDPSLQGLSCQPTQISVLCTIVTNNAPADGVIPAGHTSTRNVYQE